MAAGADFSAGDVNLGMIRAIVPQTPFTWEVRIQLDFLPHENSTTVQYSSEWQWGIIDQKKDSKAAAAFWGALDHIVKRALVQPAPSSIQIGSASPVVSIAEELRQLDGLVRDGILTREDFERAKDMFLGKAPDKREQAVELLRNLHDLMQNGILSQSEFNMKKWDILSKPSIG